jgi:hypothetical protein
MDKIKKDHTFTTCPQVLASYTKCLDHEILTEAANLNMGKASHGIFAISLMALFRNKICKHSLVCDIFVEPLVGNCKTEHIAFFFVSNSFSFFSPVLTLCFIVLLIPCFL